MRQLTEGLNFPEGPIALADGTLLVGEIATGTIARVTTDGAITRVADCRGGVQDAQCLDAAQPFRDCRKQRQRHPEHHRDEVHDVGADQLLAAARVFGPALSENLTLSGREV